MSVAFDNGVISRPAIAVGAGFWHNRQVTEQVYLPATADSLARLHTAEAVGTLVDVMRNAAKPNERTRAAELLLDRGHGRAVQAVITVPARQARALKLYAMSTAELLEIAKGGGGSTPESRSPHAGGVGGGTIQQPEATRLPLSVTAEDVIDAEFEEAIDPCS